MRLRNIYIILLSLALALSFMSCQLMTGPDKDVILKITARRIAFYGFQTKPDMFTSLGEIAMRACEQTTEEVQPLDVAFTMIVETISKKAKDPLLAQDLQDVAELIGIKFDAAGTLLGLTKENLKFINIFVCAFSTGVEAAKEAVK